MTDIEWEIALRQAQNNQGFTDGKEGVTPSSFMWKDCAEYWQGYRDGTASREKKNG